MIPAGLSAEAVRAHLVLHDMIHVRPFSFASLRNAQRERPEGVRVLVTPDQIEAMRNLPGFVLATRYGSVSPEKNELGAMELCRFFYEGPEQ